MFAWKDTFVSEEGQQHGFRVGMVLGHLGKGNFRQYYSTKLSLVENLFSNLTN